MHNLKIIGVLIFFLSQFGPLKADTTPSPLRLGWQIPWATQGQLVMALKHSNILELTGLDIDYIGFSYGGPLNKAALAGQIDILFTADQPAMVLMSRSSDFRIVARLMYNRVCIYVPPLSSINTVADLDNKNIFGPIGAAAERVTISQLKQNGLDLSSVNLGQLDMAQQSAMLAREGPTSSWRGIDALFGFDPLPAIFSSQALVKILHCGKVVSVVVAHRDVIEKRRIELQRFLKAFKMSWHLFASEPEVLNHLFAQESGLTVNNAILNEAAEIEPNRWAASFKDLQFDFSPRDFETFAETNHFLLDKKIINKPVVIQSLIQLGALFHPDAEPSAEMLRRIKINRSGSGGE